VIPTALASSAGDNLANVAASGTTCTSAAPVCERRRRCSTLAGTATLSIGPRAGTTLLLTCEVPGHEQAGMRTAVSVAS
jgi:hypothetical protein